MPFSSFLKDFYDLADLEKSEDEMRTVGILHYQVGRTDGISLEIDKWKRVLDEMGRSVRLSSGDLGSLPASLIKGFSFSSLRIYGRLGPVRR
ncbi:hypothetical protein ACFLT5_01770 [Chloroflexota bacterium]